MPKYPPRPCLICDKKFTPRQHNQVLCGGFECRMEYIRFLANGYSRQDLERLKEEGRKI